MTKEEIEEMHNQSIAQFKRERGQRAIPKIEGREKISQM